MAFVVGAGGAVASVAFPPIGVATAAVALVAPLGLSLRGRTSRLKWTRRLATVAAVLGLIEAVVVAAGALAGSIAGGVVAAAVFAMVSPAALDLALAVTAPLERRAGDRYVRSAVAMLERRPADDRRRHRLLWKDDDEGLHRPSRRALQEHTSEPAQLQQSSRARSHSE